MSYNIPVNSEDSVLIHLDSRDASSYLASSENGDLTSYFQYILTDKIICPSNQVMLISLYNASIPYSFYNIRVGINDTIDLKISNGGIDPINHTIVLPPANYTTFSLADKIELLINALSANLAEEFTFTMTYDDDLQKFDYSVEGIEESSTNQVRIDLLFNSGGNSSKTPKIEMGFKQEDIYLDTLKPLTSTNCIDINGSIHGIYVRSNLTSKSVLDSQNGNLSNILARIPIEVQAGGIIFFNSRDSKHLSVVSPLEVNIITIRLTDERNRQLDLNGLHFQVGIKIDFMYSKPKEVETTAEERRVVGITKVQQEEGQLEDALLKESQAQREKLLNLVKSGEGEVIEEDDDTLVIRKRKKPVGRPRGAGRPTNKEIKRRIKKSQEKQQLINQEDMLDKTKTFAETAGLNMI